MKRTALLGLIGVLAFAVIAAGCSSATKPAQQPPAIKEPSLLDPVDEGTQVVKAKPITKPTVLPAGDVYVLQPGKYSRFPIQQVLPLGRQAEYSGVRVAVKEVKYVNEFGGKKAASGSQFVVVTIEYENTNDQPYEPSQNKLHTLEGGEYLPINNDSNGLPKAIEKGEKKSGQIQFEVPASVTEAYFESYFSGNPISVFFIAKK